MNPFAGHRCSYCQSRRVIGVCTIVVDDIEKTTYFCQQHLQPALEPPDVPTTIDQTGKPA